MNYKSTRDSGIRVSAAQAIAQGISREGGLFVPEELPRFSGEELAELQRMTYEQRAVRILSVFLSGCFTEEEIASCVRGAYAPEKFGGDSPAPVRSAEGAEGELHFLELWHGPTCAFKDMALQLLPHLLTKSLRKIRSDKTALILVATSGDTGKAALEGFKNVAGTRILVFYPQNGVSPMQKLQMNTQEGENVSVCAIEGNFDDAQTGVKKLFTDERVNARLAGASMMFSSANSINWGRLLPQIVYYFSAYCDLLSAGKIGETGQAVNFAVPTGNFGNILAAYYAEKMGLPVGKLICASNANDVLTEFLRTGVYNRSRRFYTTISPSMDILVSSNLERLLFDLTGGDDAAVSGWMRQLSETGNYRVGPDLLDRLHELFFAASCDDEETKSAIGNVYRSAHYLCDPHTAVAVDAYRQYLRNTNDNKTPTVIVSTASPYKFAGSVLEAVAGPDSQSGTDFDRVKRLSERTGTNIPLPIAALESRPVRFRNVCTKEEMELFLCKTFGIS